ALPVLLDSLKNARQYQAAPILSTLKTMNLASSPEAIPLLIEALGDGDANTRSQAAQVLGRIGRRAKQALPALVDAVKDSRRSSSSEILQALTQLGPDALRPLVAMLESGDGPPRTEIVAALGSFGAEARQASPALVAILTDERTDEAL